MQRRNLYANPAGKFLHGVILDVCRHFGSKLALVDTGCNRRISYAEYGDLVERAACGFVAAGIRPGEFIALYLPNCWEFCVAFHAATLAAAVPTPLNPSYREREVRYQLENSGAALLVADPALIKDTDLSALPSLRRLIVTGETAPAADLFANLLVPSSATLPSALAAPQQTLAALPYSSGTTGLPKGVMLTHANVVTNAYQCVPAGEPGTYGPAEIVLCFLPLYHIYGLNVVLNPALMLGSTIVLMPRYDTARALELIVKEGVTMVPLVPPVMNAFCLAAEKGVFPRQHRLRSVMSGAAPLAAELPRRFTNLTGIPAMQGYGMTEASPVTHLGTLDPEFYRPESIGFPVALTECRLVDESGNDVAPAVDGSVSGELLIRGPQIMLGYWQSPQATAEVLRQGWYWSGDIARRDAEGFYFIVDRRKEMIKYKGFPIAPAEVESVLLEHPAVRDCGVIGRPDSEAGELPCAFIILREGQDSSAKMQAELCTYVAERLTPYKQPREVHFVEAIPRNPSGKVLRRELRKLL